MTIDASSAPGLPVVNQAQEPAWVRGGSASTQKAYSTALAFEEILVQQLTQSLSATSGVAGEGGGTGEGGGAGGSSPGGESDAGSSELSSMLPQALSAGVMSAGGLGMAAQLTRELQGGLSSSLATKAPDVDRVLQPAGGLPGGAPCGREHRPGIPAQLPPLGEQERPCP